MAGRHRTHSILSQKESNTLLTPKRRRTEWSPHGMQGNVLTDTWRKGRGLKKEDVGVFEDSVVVMGTAPTPTHRLFQEKSCLNNRHGRCAT